MINNLKNTFSFFTYQGKPWTPYIFRANASLRFCQFDVLHKFRMQIQLEQWHEPTIYSNSLCKASSFDEPIYSNRFGWKCTNQSCDPSVGTKHQFLERNCIHTTENT